MCTRMRTRAFCSMRAKAHSVSSIAAMGPALRRCVHCVRVCVLFSFFLYCLSIYIVCVCFFLILLFCVREFNSICLLLFYFALTLTRSSFTAQLLLNLRVVFISHIHADHHLGAIRIITRRQQVIFHYEDRN